MAHRFLSSILGVVLLGGAAQADLALSFIEGAPKDRFVVSNTGECALQSAVVRLDIGAAPAGLIFDTMGTGAGVEVFQPLEIVEGADALASSPRVEDGASAVALDIAELAPGARVAFTIDVDDTTSNRQITVSGSEIAGAEAMVMRGSESATAQFSENAEATLKALPCLGA